ncbi:YceI family protein [Solibacillus sp. A46]|uniref:YceI family protein n=1 Tax=Solibacillus faecavium TaxID=2762221 RepID=A0ABR8Y295_9BACL|nr:YceI family protein [Solibacillus faecavium]MBD8038314.1 YceI family protein [Solibacillus faecavium]
MTTYSVDFFHSSINFSIKHMMITKVHGTFDSFAAHIEASKIEELNDSYIRFEIDVASINTRDSSRDHHLISADFFNADRYPKITFISKEITSDQHQIKLHGDLTIKDVTRPVTFEVTYNGCVKNPWGIDTYGYTCQTEINRSDFNLTYNDSLESGGLLLSEQVKISVEIQLNKN